MRYLGVALGQSIATGTCAGFGTLFPAIFAGENLFAGKGLILLLGVSITLAGIAVIGYAGSLRSQNMTEEEKRAAVKDFALTRRGLAVALLAGVMTPASTSSWRPGGRCRSRQQRPVVPHAARHADGDARGLHDQCRLLPVAECAQPHVRRLRQGVALCNNLLFLRWPGHCGTHQFFGFGIEQTAFFEPRSVVAALSHGASSWRSTSPSPACGAYPPGVAARRVGPDRGRGLRRRS